MKKLMFAAATAAALVGMADIESSNIVGWANGPETVQGNNFVAVGFNSVGCNTFDIQQIKIEGDGIGYGLENFSIWAGSPDVVEGSGFFYWDPEVDPAGEATDYYWGDGDGNKAVFSVAPGQGVVIDCGQGLTVTSAGEVSCEDVELTTVSGCNFIANPFPVTLDIQQIKIEGDGIGYGLENFSIWAGSPEVVEGSGFFYWDPEVDPAGEATDYYWGDGDGNKATYTVAIGQSVVIDSGEGLKVKISPSYK